MQSVTSLLFYNDANMLVAGTSSGHVLQWEMTRFWSASYWTQSSESASDSRAPSRRESVMSGAIARLMMAEESATTSTPTLATTTTTTMRTMAVAGREGLALVSVPELRVLGKTALLPAQRCFNAVCRDATLSSLLCGAEDGSVSSVDPVSMENSLFFEPAEGQGAVLDLVSGASCVFVACARGFVSAIDRESRAAVWRINMRTASTSLDDSLVTGLRATVVRLDPSGKWLLCGAGSSGAANGEGGFLSIWHSETREVVSVMPTRGCPSGATWHRGAIVSCGGENVVHQFDFNGQLLASSSIDLTEAWDLACYHHPDDLVGGAIAIGGAGAHILILPAVGRKAWTLKLE